MTLIAWVFVAGTAAAEPGMCLSGAAHPMQAEGNESWSRLPMADGIEVDRLTAAQASVSRLSASAVRAELSPSQEPNTEALWCVAEDSPECSERGASHTPQLSSASVPGLGMDPASMTSPPSQTLPLPRTPYRGGPATGVRDSLRRPPR